MNYNKEAEQKSVIYTKILNLLCAKDQAKESCVGI